MRKRKATVYRSGFEDKTLADLKKIHANVLYEARKFNYILEKTYTPDLYFPGKNLYIELKGYFRPEDRAKIKAVKKQNPEIDLRIVFQKANKTITKNSKTTYGDWATKNGFLWSEGTIPGEWI